MMNLRVYVPKRYILCLLMFMGFLIMNCQRSCLSVAIVAMTTETHHVMGNRTVAKLPEFQWSSEMQGFILGSFFYGYLVLQVPGGWLCMRFGSKTVMGVAIFTSSVIHALVPLMMKLHDAMIIAARVLQGLALGVVLPTCHYMWSKWAPTFEKSSLVSFSIAGLSAGMLISYPTSGLLSINGFAGGWPSIFYTFGLCGLIWSLAWAYLTAESPRDHSSISAHELSLMDQLDAKSLSPSRSVPWRRVFSSGAVYGIMFAHFAFDASYYTLLITMPLFLNDIHRLSVAKTGIYSALPWLFMTTTLPLAGLAADKMRTVMSVGLVRKSLYGTGVVGSGIFLVIASHMSSVVGTITLLCVAVGFFGFAFSGFIVNPLDIAPKYAGIIMGISNTVATTPGFLGPALVGFATKNETPREWQHVFYGICVISVLGAVVYSVLGSGNAQSWAVHENVSAEESILESGWPQKHSSN